MHNYRLNLKLGRHIPVWNILLLRVVIRKLQAEVGLAQLPDRSRGATR